LVSTSQTPLETASATSQSTDAQSHSSAPYLVVLGGLVLLCILSWLMTSCSTVFILDAMRAELGSMSMNEYGELLNEINDSTDGTLSPLLQDTDSFTTTRAFLDSINDRPDLWAINQSGIIPASGHRITATYANSQQSVITFADSLLDIDDKYTVEMQTHLHNAMAAHDDETLTTDELNLAIKAAQAANDEINNLMVPAAEELTGARAESVVTSCTEARDNALRRWSSIEYVLECALNPSNLSLADFSYLDGWIASSSKAALENLRVALSSAMD
ncbi:MAG: hypothetical protein IJ125_09800, partial [Atopobiaceae bacterium]|nr:hypothetical protein [Atopobiaceae bacterium]